MPDQPCAHEWVPLKAAMSGLIHIQRCERCDARRLDRNPPPEPK